MRTLRAVALAGGVMVAAAASALAAAPADPGFAYQWALSGSPASIHAPQAWCGGLGGVLVADVDSGADFNHHDLAGKLVAGARFTSGNGDPANPDGTGPGAVQDDDGHGTMTTGIMVAGTSNGIGISGVAPNARALVVKVLAPHTDAHGNTVESGYGADVAAGIRYAAAYPGVRVINLSIGSDTAPLLGVINISSNPIPAAIKYAYSRGVLVVEAAGNSSNKQTDYSSVAGQSLVVGALRRDGSQASYSSPGSNVDAPGGDGGANATMDTSVLSTYLGDAYAVGDGTSFAAPHVAGTAALLMARGLSAAQARQAILATVTGPNLQLDAAAALGQSDGGPACAPPASGAALNGAGSGAGSLNVKPATPSATHRSQPATRSAAPAVAPASPSPSPSVSPSVEPAPSPSTSPSASPYAPVQRTPKPAGSTPAPLLAAGVLGGAGIGYGALRMLLGLR